MTRPSLRFTSYMLIFMGLMFGLHPTSVHAQQVSADIQIGNGDKTLNSNTTLQTKAGDKLTIEIFATGYTDAQGLEVILQLSDLTAFVPDGQGNYASGSSPEFEVPIKSMADNQFKLSTVTFQAAKSYTGDPKLVATLSLTLSETFSSASITILSTDFGGNAVDPNIDPNEFGQVAVNPASTSIKRYFLIKKLFMLNEKLNKLNIQENMYG